MPGYLDRENAANKLAAQLADGQSSEDEDGGDDDTDVVPLLNVAVGGKTKGHNTSKSIHPALESFLNNATETQEKTEQLLIESMNSREDFQDKHLKLSEKKNEISLQRNQMLSQLIESRTQYQEVSIMANGKDFSTCLELRDIAQITGEVADYLGIESKEISGLLRSFMSNLSTMSSVNGQKVTRASQLFSDKEITVSVIELTGKKYIIFKA